MWEQGIMINEAMCIEKLAAITRLTTYHLQLDMYLQTLYYVLPLCVSLVCIKHATKGRGWEIISNDINTSLIHTPNVTNILVTIAKHNIYLEILIEGFKFIAIWDWGWGILWRLQDELRISGCCREYENAYRMKKTFEVKQTSSLTMKDHFYWKEDELFVYLYVIDWMNGKETLGCNVDLLLLWGLMK